MDKPTLFFSHSSKDKEVILAIKNRIMKYTSNTLDIFQSSDGESIPFGSNWVHKVEEGLNSAKIMFVFVTENSISSGWTFFEAGFAYSKNIQVVPVGIGVNVRELRAPLNLLQGFNVTSADSLNNFIAIINREFNYYFDECFVADDYYEIMSCVSSMENISAHFSEIVRSVRYSLPGSYSEGPGEILYRDTKNVFEQMINYLDKHDIEYSLSNSRGYRNNKVLAVSGIKITYNEPDVSQNKDSSNSGNIDVSISPYNFAESFDLYLKLNSLFAETLYFYVQIVLSPRYVYTVEEEDCAALLMASPEWFSMSREHVGGFECGRLKLYFSIYDNNTDRRKPEEFVLGIGYNPLEIESANIVTLVENLYNLKIINRKGD